MKTMADMNIHLGVKFQLEQVEEDPVDKIDRKRLGSDQYKLDKLYEDRKLLKEVLLDTSKDMFVNRCYDSLSAINSKLEYQHWYRANLIEEEARNKIVRREMSRQLRQQRNYIKTVLYDTNMTVEHLKCKVEDTETLSQVRSRYIDNWQQARTEQNKQQIAIKESAPSDKINYYQTRLDQEQRIHSEVELLVNIAINEILMKVDKWMNKFDADMEVQDLKIAKMKNKYIDAMDKRIELEKTYATHETLIKNWIQFKEDRDKANEYRNKMTNSAIVVQAWWRGLMVRLQMGPYKPTRKAKSGRKAEDKKK